MNRDIDKAERFDGFFASFFNYDDKFYSPQVPKSEHCDCDSDQLPAKPELVGDMLFHLRCACVYEALVGLKPW